ncbi:MAG: hypothetical protein KA200_00175 [Burkholderiales bacterium]|nr:hypothetical protein [Burkholderiales bacterium]
MTYQELLKLINPANQARRTTSTSAMGDTEAFGSTSDLAGWYDLDPNNPLVGSVQDNGDGGLTFWKPRDAQGNGGGIDYTTYGADGKVTASGYRADSGVMWRDSLIQGIATIGGAMLAGNAGTLLTAAGGTAGTAGTGALATAAPAAAPAATAGVGSLLTPTNALLAGSLLSSTLQARNTEQAMQDATAANERIAADQASAAERVRLDAERARQAAIAAGGSQPGRSPAGTAGARQRNRGGLSSTMLTGAGGVNPSLLSLGQPTLLGRLG